jgi:hypothetical protein
MSHHQETGASCPNCGHTATLNYCPNCGQATHLHKETFWGLILHFIGHYFHYDSKFLKTMKMLWFRPGQLTLAYWNQQRERYIPPISLYIFISAVYFLVFFAKGPSKKELHQASKLEASKFKYAGIAANRHDSVAFANSRLARMSDEQRTELLETTVVKMVHDLPKLFIFMIPFMAFILKMVYAKREEMFFVDHAVFSLHFHSLAFSAMIISALNPFEVVEKWLGRFLLLGLLIYFTAALKNAYQTGWLKSAGYTILNALAYCMILVLLFAIYATVWFLIIS